jgi:hypothetical protein
MHTLTGGAMGGGAEAGGLAVLLFVLAVAHRAVREVSPR